MKKIITVFKTIRNNWKKSTLAATAVYFGVNYGVDSYNTRQLMRRYCEEAAKYGDEPQPIGKSLRRITVILNPAAGKKKSKDMYDKYCAPLLHLAGVIVNVVQTDYAGQAKELHEVLDPHTDAIVIAGGDGTFSETVTGLLRRAEGNLKALASLPIAVLPLGRTNELSNALCGEQDEVRSMAEATMSVIDGTLRNIDVVKIEPLEGEGRPIYCIGRIEWGAHKDVWANRDKFWMFGPWREYVAYLFAGSPQPMDWSCQYSEPCGGCSNCYVPEKNVRRWWHAFTQQKPPAPQFLVPNEKCGLLQEKELSTVRLSILTDTLTHNFNGTPQISLQSGPPNQGKFSLTSEGWAKLRGENPRADETLPVQSLRLTPKQQDESWFAIDSEDFEVKPVALTLLPKALSVFTPRKDRSL